MGTGESKDQGGDMALEHSCAGWFGIRVVLLYPQVGLKAEEQGVRAGPPPVRAAEQAEAAAQVEEGDAPGRQGRGGCQGQECLEEDGEQGEH